MKLPQLASLAFVMLALPVSCRHAPSNAGMAEVLGSHVGKMARVVTGGTAPEQTYRGTILRVDPSAEILTLEYELDGKKSLYFIRIDRIESVRVEEK